MKYVRFLECGDKSPHSKLRHQGSRSAREEKVDQDALSQRLSRITTIWTLVRNAHGPTPDASAAQQALLERYSGAAHRYLLGALRDADAAEELFQEFALRLVRGDFKNADPSCGRLRDFLKTALFHLIVDYQKGRQKRAQPLAEGTREPAVAPDLPESEQRFLDSWRQELMERTWLALAELEKQTGQPSHTVLHLRTEHPLASSAELAERVGARLGKALTVDAVRQALHRAREKFTELLLQEVVVSLGNPSPEELEDELTQLGLLAYCRPALAKRGGGPRRA
jgi:RNA polymerase sigma-70 factor (ECF subfamily)